MKHIEEVQEWLANNNLDIAYISDFHNIRYYTGFDSDPIERILALFIFQIKILLSLLQHLKLVL